MLTAVLAHWLACLWGLTGQQLEGQGETWHARLPPRMYAAYGTGDAQFDYPFALYGVCLYVALCNIFGGASEIYPENEHEYYVQALMMMLGSCVWAFVIGSCCSILATLNPALIEYRQTMDELNVFVKDHGMPQELTVRPSFHSHSSTQDLSLHSHSSTSRSTHAAPPLAPLTQLHLSLHSHCSTQTHTAPQLHTVPLVT